MPKYCPGNEEYEMWARQVKSCRGAEHKAARRLLRIVAVCLAADVVLTCLMVYLLWKRIL